MIGAITGRLGTGKTAYLTWILKKSYEEGRRIAANYPLVFPHDQLTHPFQLINLEDCVLGLDEAYLWFSSVGSQRKLQIALSNIYRKFRKKNVDVYVTSQRFKNLHIRYRELCDIKFQMRRVPPVGPVKYFLAYPCNPQHDMPFGSPIKFVLDEVKDLYDTKADIYSSPEQDQLCIEILASAPASEYFAGKRDETGLDELVSED